MTKTSCWRSIGAATAAGLIDAAVQRAEELVPCLRNPSRISTALAAPGCVARQLNTARYSPSSRLARNHDDSPQYTTDSRDRGLGIAIVTVILDDSGVLEMMRRMDGAPIENDGEIVGAIGVSGGYYRQDEACVQAALESLVGS